jgi:hypothetical protein
MTVALNTARKDRAIKSTTALQVLLAQRDFSSEGCTSLLREADYLAGLLFDSPCEQLGKVLRRVLWRPDEELARNALLALEHELTEGVC